MGRTGRIAVLTDAETKYVGTIKLAMVVKGNDLEAVRTATLEKAKEEATGRLWPTNATILECIEGKPITRLEFWTVSATGTAERRVHGKLKERR